MVNLLKFISNKKILNKVVILGYNNFVAKLCPNNIINNQIVTNCKNILGEPKLAIFNIILKIVNF